MRKPRIRASVSTRLTLTEEQGRREARARISLVAQSEAAALGVRYTRITMRNQRSRWGSCSSTGALSFNWRLVLAPHDVLDYVVVHEVCHLVELNHGPAFWNLLDAAVRATANRRRGSTSTGGRSSLTALRKYARRKLSAMERWATFDCYGTLIDWNGGIGGELARVFGAERRDDLLARYHQIERDLQRDGTRSYHEVLVESMAALGAPPEEQYALAESLPSWRAFPEAHAALAAARSGGWKLAVLSNTDDDYIAASQIELGITFDEVVVAQEISSYKPAHRHWDEFFARTRAPREGHVHVAASLFHDIAPASELGLRSIWINRLGEEAVPAPTRELTDLSALPETLDELVPA